MTLTPLAGWREALAIVQPLTILAWQYQRVHDHWRDVSQGGQPGRPAMAEEGHKLSRDISQANPWKTFLTNHVQDLVALDFIVVPTVTYQVLFVLLILAQHRRWLETTGGIESPTH